MSKFNSYAKKLDEKAQAALKEYQKAERAYRDASRKEQSFPKGMNGVLPKFAIDHARAKVDMQAARDEYNKAKQHLEDVRRELMSLRNDLAADVDETYTADPKKLDGATLELLRSGILTPREYDKLIDSAQAEGNYTLSRIAGKYADDAAKAAADNNDRVKERELRMVARKARINDGSEYLDTFDSLIHVYDRCAASGALIDKWESLTGEIIENF